MTFDFTIDRYKLFLDTFIQAGYTFQTVSDYLVEPASRAIILRQDVDKLPENSLKFACLQQQLGIRSTFYFRIVPVSFNIEIIKEIANLGHEIGYHYEDIDLAFQVLRRNGIPKNSITKELLFEHAYSSFTENLSTFRQLYPVKTICMHGSPRAPFDNKLLWERYSYRDHGIIGEPYLDIDFAKCAYFSDTGRTWNGTSYNIRDVVKTNYRFGFRTTNEIIANIDKLPDRILFTFHPQRWNNDYQDWVLELIMQNLKNQVKKYFVK
jgi:hypothetical protein